MFKKTHKGSGFGDMLGTLVCIVALMLIVVSMVYFFKILEVKRNINTYARSSLLVLEQQGSLNETDIEEISNKLTNLGIDRNNIVITYNNDNTTAQYGEEVIITIEVNATYEELGLSPYVSELIGKNFKYKTEYASISKK
ncbi:DUF4320 family protein [Lachnospira multipara]|uniref:DUF4320 family protein n=1 Tax=Lachnospira multipara TaxID=28051 RepID=UPI0003FCA4D0|nr:DUF4320 family protein [Lachnospira multipara]